jgi:arabinan endo-1,5-alpha-L-arabinosidase
MRTTKARNLPAGVVVVHRGAVGLLMATLVMAMAGCDTVTPVDPGDAAPPAESSPDPTVSDPADEEDAPEASEPASESEAVEEPTGTLPDAFSLSGDLGAHDPTMLRASDGTYVVYSTHEGLQARTSADLSQFTRDGAALPDGAEWAAEYMDGDARAMWAPDASLHDGTYYLYYSASTFGSNTSAIGLATSTTGLPGSWTDQGEVISSSSSDNFNAIDPSLTVDADGNWWLTFGSFWDGIKMVAIDPATGKRADDEIVSLASRGGGAIEGADMIEHDGAYYLFVAFDRCCAGTDSTYRVMVGRSDSPTGPFVDRNGRQMLDGGGTEILATSGDRIGPGGADVYSEGGDDVLVYHFYDGANNGAPRLAIDRIEWVDGWPQVE